jgi:hypothetical protein
LERRSAESGKDREENRDDRLDRFARRDRVRIANSANGTAAKTDRRGTRPALAAVTAVCDDERHRGGLDPVTSGGATAQENHRSEREAGWAEGVASPSGC